MVFMEAPHFVTYVQNIVQGQLLCLQSVSDARGRCLRAMAAACHGLMYVAPSFVHSRIAGMAAGT